MNSVLQAKRYAQMELSPSMFQAEIALLFHHLRTVHYGVVQYEIPKGSPCQLSASDQSEQR